MNAKITNLHNFCEGYALTIKNDKPEWCLRRKNQRVEEILNPIHSIDDFIKIIHTAFSFTRAPETLTIENEQKLTKWNVIDYIYNTPLEYNVTFVRIDKCDCNFEHCSTVVGINVDQNEYKTYGDVFKLFGVAITDENGHTYYEYPDSTYLYLQQIYNLPKKVHEGGSCNNNKINVTEKMDPNKIYISWYYNK